MGYIMSFTQKWFACLALCFALFVLLKELGSPSVETETETKLCQVSGEVFKVDCESLRIK